MPFNNYRIIQSGNNTHMYTPNSRNIHSTGLPLFGKKKCLVSCKVDKFRVDTLLCELRDTPKYVTYDGGVRLTHDMHENMWK